MKTHILHYSLTVDAPIHEVCSFHTNTHNLPLITPPWISVEIDSMDEPFIEKSRVSLIIKRFGIPTRWVMEIETMDCPNNVTDRMVSGPFSYFHHNRSFTSLGPNQTRMNEKITLKLPFGWLGDMLFPLLKMDMDKMFAYRHQATSDFFTQHKH